MENLDSVFYWTQLLTSGGKLKITNTPYSNLPNPLNSATHQTLESLNKHSATQLGIHEIRIEATTVEYSNKTKLFSAKREFSRSEITTRSVKKCVHFEHTKKLATIEKPLPNQSLLQICIVAEIAPAFSNQIAISSLKLFLESIAEKAVKLAKDFQIARVAIGKDRFRFNFDQSLRRNERFGSTIVKTLPHLSTYTNAVCTLYLTPSNEDFFVEYIGRLRSNSKDRAFPARMYNMKIRLPPEAVLAP